MPEVPLTVKPLGMLSNHPKFNTKLKDKQPGTWYMFLQIFDKDNLSSLYYSNQDILVTTLELKCRIINGLNDSLILDTTLAVELYRHPAPPDEVTLKRLAAYPAYFVQAFDSIATWLLQSETESQKTLTLKPACIFSESKFEQEPLTQLYFKSDNYSIDHLTEPQFSFYMPGPTYKKMKSRRNIGGNTATGLLTFFTGLRGNKMRVYEYNADFPFEIKDSTAYHCVIHYAERQSAEREREKEKNSDGSVSYTLHSGEYGLMERGVDSSFINVISFGNDTLVTFRITYVNNENEYNSYTHLWDGSDSATIIALPQE
jgi:hypothetical protein